MDPRQPPKSPAPSLSIVVPAYNESLRLGTTLERLEQWRRTQAPRAIDIVVVDDGSRDATVAVAEAMRERAGGIEVLRAGRNLGKGAAVRRGVLQARGDYILFSDADLSTPIEEVARLEEALAHGADLAIGSRALPGSDVARRQAWPREMMGRTFNRFVQALVFRGVRDTQCGFKLFRAEVAHDLFARQRIDGFAFDVEILYLARQSGYRVAEVPVRWLNDEASRVHPLVHSAQMLRDIVRIRALHRRR